LKELKVWFQQFRWYQHNTGQFSYA